MVTGVATYLIGGQEASLPLRQLFLKCFSESYFQAGSRSEFLKKRQKKGRHPRRVNGLSQGMSSRMVCGPA